MQIDRAKTWAVLGGLSLAVVVLAIAVPAARKKHLAVLYLARAIEGEGAGLFENREEVGTWIAHTALNRLDSPWWPDTMEQVVVEGFYGHVRVSDPSDWAKRVARRAMSRREDRAQGAVFLLSGEDLRTHGWSATGALRCFEQDEYTLCFFCEWPGETEPVPSLK